jgi:hypothetical protein
MFVEGGTEVKTNPYTIQSLIAWLETKPADATYRYDSPYHCLLHQYFTAAGVKFNSIGPGYIRYAHDPYHRESLPRGFEEIAVGDFYKGRRGNMQTFGAALNRARGWLTA